MVNRDAWASPPRRQKRILADQGKMWTAALVCASILASQDTLSVTAFQVSLNPFRVNIASNGDTRSPTHLYGATAPSRTVVIDEARSKLAPSVTPTMLSPSRMFLKAGQVSLQPVSSLSSDFFDTPPTQRPRLSDEGDDVPIYIPQRTRGILGFVLNDQVDDILSSAKRPPSMEDTSTSLHSSTDERQSSSSKVDFETWNLPRSLDEEDWLSSPSSNPILNRSPSGPTKDEAATTTSPAWFPWMPSITQIEALKVRELRQICSDRGLKQVGTCGLCGISPFGSIKHSSHSMVDGLLDWEQSRTTAAAMGLDAYTTTPATKTHDWQQPRKVCWEAIST